MSPPPVAVSLVDPFAVLKTEPAQVLLTPVLFPSESAQKTSGAKFVLIVAAAELITLRLDFRISEFPTPETVMFAPTDRSPVEEVEVIATSGAVIAPLVATEPHSTVTALAEIDPAEVFANAPALQVAVNVLVADTAPETVVSPAELEISTVPREVMGAPLVIVEELESLTVPALIAPVPVLTVEAALEIITSWAAVNVAFVFEKAFDAPVE
jgi:hypothetical protein